MRKLDFYKDSNGWFIDLPDYPGEKWDLQMVAGADKMLDVLSKGSDLVTLEVDEPPFSGAENVLILDYILNGWGTYRWAELFGDITRFKDGDVGLCPVTEYVFGHFPDNIYFKTI